MTKFVSRAALISLFAVGLSAGTANVQAAELPKDANTTCPVMVKEEVDPDLYVDYEGRRVYLCCTKCKRRFMQNPKKYLHRLPKADDGKTTAARKLALTSKK